MDAGADLRLAEGGGRGLDADQDLPVHRLGHRYVGDGEHVRAAGTGQQDSTHGYSSIS
ncbi:hypothetical protein [Actinocatenispora rupis]|uniref:hypothetical protein n=1 Tax=Actinocatenispora rupis TaxID=519421 RepID=UPI001EF35FA7|nr:hypothetical protein [Actinocatenispora rupis]